MHTLSPSRRRQLTADGLLLLVTAVWGGTFVMVKDAIRTYPVYQFLALRFSLATLVLLVVSGGRLRNLGWRGWGAGALIGVVLFAGYALQTIGLQYTSASKAGLITGLSVVMVPVLQSLMARQKAGFAVWAGVAMATAGLALLTLATVDGLSFARGDLIVLGCALAFALHIIAVSVFAPRTDALALTFVQVLVVALLALGMGFTEAPWRAPAGRVSFAAGFTGVLATAVAFAVQNSVQRYTTPTHTALLFAAEPAFAALFGVWLAGETLTPRGLVGGVLILLGTIVNEVPWPGRPVGRRVMARKAMVARDEPG